MDRRAFLRRSAPIALVGLAGCTGGDDTPTSENTPTSTEEPMDSPTATETATPTTEPTESPTSTDSPTPTEESTPTPEPDQEVVVGPGGDLRFEPKSFTISAGDTVLWRWDSGGHNVSPSGIPEGSSWAGKDETTYSAGTMHVYTFETTGTYDYVCTPHQSVGMTGSFTVE